jgi:hypothetical protein
LCRLVPRRRLGCASPAQSARRNVRTIWFRAQWIQKSGEAPDWTGEAPNAKRI